MKDMEVIATKKIPYKCDPSKNSKCKKSNCHLYDRPCKNTMHFEYSKKSILNLIIYFINKVFGNE